MHGACVNSQQSSTQQPATGLSRAAQFTTAPDAHCKQHHQTQRALLEANLELLLTSLSQQQDRINALGAGADCGMDFFEDEVRKLSEDFEARWGGLRKH